MTEEPCTQEINQVCDVADESLSGWAYWQFKTFEDLTTSAGTGSEGFWNQDGSLQDYKVKALARSYLPYTQGTLNKMKFDTNTSYLKANFTYSESTKDSETVLYLNQEYWYINGYELVIKKNDEPAKKIDTEKNRGNNYFRINVADELGAVDGDDITITVWAKRMDAVEVTQ